jgi:hypothetical protein
MSGMGDAITSDNITFSTQIIILFGVPATLTAVILILLLGIKFLILMPDKK